MSNIPLFHIPIRYAFREGRQGHEGFEGLIYGQIPFASGLKLC